MTEPLDLDAIKERFERGYPGAWTSGESANARNADVRALVAEVERLRGKWAQAAVTASIERALETTFPSPPPTPSSPSER